MNAGLVVLDASSIKHLEADEARSNLHASLRANWLELWPSVMNVLEVVKTRNPRVRTRLLRTIAELAADRPLLPWPHELLRQVGAAVAEGRRETRVGERRLQRLLKEPDSISESEVENVRRFLQEREQDFTSMHQRARRVLRPILRQHGALDRWGSVGNFLDSVWNDPDHLDDYLVSLWDALQCPGQAPVEELRKVDGWKLFLEGVGAAAFERAVRGKTPKRVQEADLLQLVYLGGSHRRILVTNDRRFRELASSMLHGRHTLARVISVKKLLRGGN